MYVCIYKYRVQFNLNYTLYNNFLGFAQYDIAVKNVYTIFIDYFTLFITKNKDNCYYFRN